MRALTWTLLALLGIAAPAGAAPALQDPAVSEPTERETALEDWRARLSDTDLARRELAFERLIQAVRQSPAFAGVLREWAADAAHPELAWTARLALRELSRAPSFAFPDFFQAPGLSLGPGSWPDLESALGVPLTGGSAFESFQFSQGPEGVSIRVETETNGQRETKTYEGRTLEEILEANPELEKKLSASRSALQRSPAVVPQLGWPARPQAEPEASAAPLRTDVLGVIVREPTAAERGRAGLSRGGLTVEQVAEGTIADVLGLRPGVILVEINGKAIDSKDAISSALAERAPDGELRLSLFDAFGRRQTRTWRPAPAAQARGASGL